MSQADTDSNFLDSAFDVTSSAAWRTAVGALCAGNSRLVFSASCALAAPLLHMVAMESFGFHFWGRSKCGKTLALRVANSVSGGPPTPLHMTSSVYMNQSQLERKRFALGLAGNAMTAAAHCDRVMAVDEAGAEVLPQFSFLLSGCDPKTPSLAWRLLLLSAGEGAPFAPVERLAMLPMDASAGMGCLSSLHGMESASALAKTIEQRTAANGTGSVLRIFTSWVHRQSPSISRRIRESASFLAASFLAEAASVTQHNCNGLALDGSADSVERMAARFALVGIAGALATEAGLTGWAVGESEAAAKACFDAWLKSFRPGAS